MLMAEKPDRTECNCQWQENRQSKGTVYKNTKIEIWMRERKEP